MFISGKYLFDEQASEVMTLYLVLFHKPPYALLNHHCLLYTM